MQLAGITIVSHKLSDPIFYDPLRRRWRRFQRTVQLIVLGLVFIFVPLIASIVIHPALPNLRLHSVDNNQKVAHVEHLSPAQPNSLTAAPEHIQFNTYLAQSDSPVSVGSTIPVAAKRTEAIGFYVNWDPNSFTSLKQHFLQLDKLMPEWLHLAKSDGSIAVDDPVKQKETLTFIRKYRPNLPIIPLINNFDNQIQNWNGKLLAQTLNQPSSRKRLIQNLLQFVRSNGFAGINIDFESVPAKSQPALVAFMRELYAQFHPLGLEVSQSLPPDDRSFDYRALANCNDYLILMIYDEHYSSSAAGPIASQNWYADKLQRILAQLPANKYVIGIGNYGYDWQANQTLGNEISFLEAIKLAKESKAQIALDRVTSNPTFDYYDEQHHLHHVWYLDAVTAYNQIVEAQHYAPRGFAVWRLGSEDPGLWKVLAERHQLGQAATEMLTILPITREINYIGKGEIIKVTSMPQDGMRKITYDPQSGLITQEHFTNYPSSLVISRWGGENDKKIALTFDDGPNKDYTPQILDILRRYNVQATFFVIGMNANSNPDLLQQIYKEGHEIGNHTFTHPNMATLSEQQAAFEINANQSLLESYLGRHSLLFRPPYGEDIEPVTAEEVKPVIFTSNLGYYTVAMHIDPKDWRKPDADDIVKKVISQAVNGEGKIVLLHDGGGDRSQTIEALPQIIEGLREQGFQLVTVSDLIGVSRNAVMPAIKTDEKILTTVNATGFRLINGFNFFVYYLCIFGAGFVVIRVCFVVTLSIYECFKKPAIKSSPEYMPAVSVVVPAFNEEKVILKAIHSLLRSDYPNFNIIVVDDESTDLTYKDVVEAFGNHQQVQIFTKSNGGKAHALNYGIKHSKAEIIIAVDADTILLPDTISKLVRHFIDPRIGAIAGNVKVGNRINLLTKWQALEYITTQNLERRAFGLLNCICVVPGAIGAWRRQVLLQVGGLTSDTLAEDGDLTLKVLRMGYKIDFDEDAIALTEAPDTLSGFLKQRFRWSYGTLQVFWKHRDIAFRPRYGALGMFAMPNMILFQIAFGLWAPLIDLLTLIALAWAAWQKIQHPESYSLDAVLGYILFYYVLFLVVDFLSALIAFMMEPKENSLLLIWLLPQRLVYRFLMYYVIVKSTLTAIQGKLVGWGKAERKASVPST